MDTLHTISKESKDLKGQEYLDYVTQKKFLGSLNVYKTFSIN